MSSLLGLGFTPEEQEKPVSVLSGGEKAKVQLAKLLLSGANLLLLDEPTNHLDIAALTWLEKFLLDYRGAYIIISHDRYFLDTVTTRTFELENKRLTIYKGGYSAYRKKSYSPTEIARAKRFYGKHKEFTEALIKGHDTYNEDVEELERLKEAGRAFIIQPESPVSVGRAERRKAVLDALYQQAFEQTLRMKDEILAFLGGEAK